MTLVGSLLLTSCQKKIEYADALEKCGVTSYKVYEENEEYITILDQNNVPVYISDGIGYRKLSSETREDIERLLSLVYDDIPEYSTDEYYANGEVFIDIEGEDWVYTGGNLRRLD